MDSTTDHSSARRLARSPVFARAAQVGLMVLLSLVLAGPASSANENVQPVASFTFSPSSPVIGERVTFSSTSSDSDGRIVYQAWDLDNDGSYDDGTASTATRTFSSAGSYTVRLLAVDDDWDYRTTSRTVTVKANAAPVPAFSVSPSEPETGQTVTLTSSSTDPDGRPLTEEWDLDNDGAFDDRTGSQATTSFANNGVRRVSLRVTDSGGTVRTTFRDITVRNRPPQAAFAMSAAEVDTGSPIDFTSTSTDPDGSISSYQWDFNGDGVADATGPTVRRSFAANGTPTVTLTVTDDDGASRSASRQVTIRNRPPQAAFGMSATEVDTGDPVDFTSTSTDPDGAISSYQWDFNGDGTADATGPTARHSFAANGTPTVTLTITDDDGASRSASRQVTVRNRAPSASFGYAPAQPMTGEEIVLTSTSTDRDGTLAEHRWDLDGDGAFDDATGAEVHTSFANAGSYMVALQVRDDDGATSPPAFTSIEVTRRPDPPAGDPPATHPPANGPSTTDPSSTDSPVPGPIAPRLLDPFPRVGIRGVTTPTGARLQLLWVRTTGGTRIVVRCKGRGCPWARYGQSARFSASRTRVVRVPGFSRRHLRAGAVIEVFVTRDGMIGKYTRVKIRRRLKPPKRIDRCTAPGAARAQRCLAG